MLIERFLPRTEFDSYEDFFENYKVTVPEGFNFGFDVVDAWAEVDKDKPALCWCDDHGGENRLSFGEISALSNRVANYLAHLGIRKGHAVMLILRRRWEYWVIAPALHKLGAVLIPGSLQLTAKDITYRAGAADIKLIISCPDAFPVEQVEKAAGNCPSLLGTMLVGEKRDGWLDFEAYLGYPDVFQRPVGDDATKVSDPFLIYFTSGTTGMPKMALHNFTYPLGHIVTAKYWQKVQDGKLHMSVSDSGWAKFGWGKIYGQWICGAVIFAYDMDKFVPAKLLEMLQKYKVTTFCAPPTMYRFMLQEDLTKYDLSSIQHACNAGEPLNADVYNKFKSITGLSLTEGFGQSESPVMVANYAWYPPKPGSMGKPTPLYDIALIDGDGNLCDDGVEGEIVVRGIDKSRPVGLFVEYYKNADATAAAFHDGCYFTGDVAWRDGDGYYWFVGRNDDVIKCSGYRIGPFEVESALVEHPAVVECAVTAAPDPVRGQVVKASVVLAAGYTGSEALTKELQTHVKRVTAPYKYPRIIDYVAELPKTTSGKIKRAQIRNDDHSNA
ncbi:AMP-binding protein [Oscillospiraceae bacterium OttesenSCG-928-F05]|nr:AMP-binding protein [Oscillospiraceae bacterium OttesenSCG-928-F05]